MELTALEIRVRAETTEDMVRPLDEQPLVRLGLSPAMSTSGCIKSRASGLIPTLVLTSNIRYRSNARVLETPLTPCRGESVDRGDAEEDEVNSNTPGSPSQEVLGLHGDPEAIPDSVLLASVPVGVLTYQADGRCTSANEAAAEVLGISRDRLLEQNFRTLSSWRDSGLLAHAEATLQHDHPFDGRLSVTTTSGRDLCLEWRLRRIDLDTAAALLVVFEDVTERDRAEKALRLTQLSVDKSADLIHWVDAAGRIIYVSDSTCQRHGYSREELLKMTIFDLDPTMTPELWTERWISYKDGGSHTIETVHKTKRGDLFPSELTLNYVESDGITYQFAYARDITNRVGMEESLRLTQFSVDRALDYVYWLNSKGGFVFASEAACRRLGYPLEELLTMTIFDVDPQAPRDWSEHFRDIKERGSFTFERVHMTKAGETFPVEVTVNYVEFNGKEYDFVSARDITERKRAEEELRRSHDLLNITGQLAKVGGWELIPETQALTWTEEVYRIHEVEPATRLSVAEAINFYAPQAQPVISAAVQAAIETGAPFDLELPLITARGRHIWVRAQGAVERRDGKTVRLYGALQDITGRRQAEEAMGQRLAELEALHAVSGSLRTAQTRDEAVPIVLDEMVAALETDAGALWLYDADSDELRSAASRGWLKLVTITPSRPGESLVGTVFTNGQTHISAELASDPLVRQSSRGLTPAGWGGVCAPIRTGEITIGVLLVSVPPAHPITPHHVSLLESLAGMAGAALHRMSLHEETERRLDQLQAMHRVDQAISAGTDLRMTLNLLLDHVANQLQVDAADVLLLNPHTLTLEYAAGRGFRITAATRAHIRLGESLAGLAALERRVVHVDGPVQAHESSRLAALQGVEGFVAYHAVPLVAKGQVLGVLEVFHRAPLSAGQDWVDLLETLAGQAAIALENAQLFEGMQRSNLDLALAYDATIEGWSRAVDLRDKETEGHTQRVTEMTMRLAHVVGIVDAELAHVRRGALLHDIGKLGVPDGILLKPGPLSEEEWVLMRRHPQLAYDLLAPITYLRPALDIPYCHHERWDGTGYPRGLAGEQIPLTARLFAVVDVWDALRSDRPYRKAWTEEHAREHIEAGSGTHFDPKAVEVFLHALNQGTG
jgi:PAS domain S-box-containing protein